MKFFEQLFFSFRFYGKTFRFIDEHNLYRHLIIPALISLGVAVFVAWVGWKTSGNVIFYLLSALSFRERTGFWGDLAEAIFRFIIRILTLLFYLKIFRYLLLIVLSPFFTRISAKVQAIELGEDNELSFKALAGNILRSTEIAILNFFRDVMFTGLILIIVIIVTWLVPLIPFAIFFVESYFLGYAMIDYRNQFLHKSVKDSRRVIHENIGLAVGNGICFNLILLVPLFGIMFGPVLALIAAGISIDENVKINIKNEIDQSL